MGQADNAPRFPQPTASRWLSGAARMITDHRFRVTTAFSFSLSRLQFREQPCRRLYLSFARERTIREP
jgi:hypothetical protein